VPTLDGGPPDGGPPGADCATQAAEECAIADRCFPGLRDWLFGDTAQCEREVAYRCELVTTAPGSIVTTAMTAGCRAAWTTCDARAGAPPEACLYPPGTRAIGDPCAIDEQCGLAPSGRAMRCRSHTRDGSPTRGSFCESGICSDTVDRGSLCDGTLLCEPGLTCVPLYDPAATAAGADAPPRCAPFVYGAEGERCAPGTDHVCRVGLYCAEGRCAPVLARGEPCVRTEDTQPCDTSAGDLCIDGACTRALLAFGDPCAPALVCPNGSVCEDGFCTIPTFDAIDGDACDRNADCAYGLWCAPTRHACEPLLCSTDDP
jgi:hypothetical protein